MKLNLLIFLLLFYKTGCFCQQKDNNKQEVDYINSYIGTAEDKQGATMPFVGAPFAMTNFTPATCESTKGRMPYIYEDSTIMSFLGSHKPTVWMGEYGEVAVMPEIGDLKLSPQQRQLPFSHKDEIVSPYYYSVKMKAGKEKYIQTEIAATERCGIFRFTFPQSNVAHILVQAINIDDAPEPFFDANWTSKKNRLKLTSYINIDVERKK